MTPDELDRLKNELRAEFKQEIAALKAWTKRRIEKSIENVKWHTAVWFTQAMRGGATISAMMGLKKAEEAFLKSVDEAEKIAGRGELDDGNGDDDA
jgi:hypothetical protein